jgi:hypothetical protein
MNMLSVTDPALKQLHDTLTDAPGADDGDKCFRIVPKDAATLTLAYMEPEATDATFEFEGQTVLALPDELKDYCADRSLDINDDGKLELA